MTVIVMLMMIGANAGTLADGFRGHAFGPRSNLDLVDHLGCGPDEPPFALNCQSTVGGAPVELLYLADDVEWYGVYIRCNNIPDCSRVIDAVEGMYGKSTRVIDGDDSKFGARAWGDGGNIAAWRYDGVGHLVITDVAAKMRVDARAKDASTKEGGL